MKEKETGVVFINYGNNDYEQNRDMVMKEDAEEIFNEIFKALPFRGWVSMNSTYVSFDKRIQQGECIKYRNKMN